MKTLLLLVEDEPAIANLISVGLDGFTVITAGTLAEARQKLMQYEVGAVLADLNLPDSKGENTLIELQKLASHIPIVVLTGGGDISFQRAIHLGAQDFVIKGSFGLTDLIRALRFAIERHKVRKAFVPLKEEIERTQAILTEMKGLINGTSGK